MTTWSYDPRFPWDEHDEALRTSYRDELQGLIAQFARGEIDYADRELQRVSSQLTRTNLRRYTDPDPPTNRLYVAGFHGGHGWYVKAGKAAPGVWENRVKQHRRIARVHGYVATGLWVSPWLEPSQVSGVETQLLNSLYLECMRLAHSHAIPEEDRHDFRRDGEYFIGMHFDEAEPVAENVIRTLAEHPV
ncbi:hypothetical protein ACH5AU_29375 [Streptomyces albidoflavus]